MTTIKDIPGLTSPHRNEAYQNYIFNRVWEAIILATRDTDAQMAYLRNEDIIEALISIQAMVLSSSADAKVPSRLRQHCEDFSKKLRSLTSGFVEQEKTTGESLFDSVIDTDKMQ